MSPVDREIIRRKLTLSVICLKEISGYIFEDVLRVCLSRVPWIREGMQN